MPRLNSFAGRRILLVEDDYFIAGDFAASFALQGAEVIGPVSNLEDAQDLAARTEEIDGAVLDINLQGETVYALVDVQRGTEFCGVPPQDALPVLLDRGRTPLTILEGITFVLLHPQALEKNACFMLSGSRRGDRRVPALWISGKAPKLGWCWDGNPHTWLGVASARARVAVTGHA